MTEDLAGALAQPAGQGAQGGGVSPIRAHGSNLSPNPGQLFDLHEFA